MENYRFRLTGVYREKQAGIKDKGSIPGKGIRSPVSLSPRRGRKEIHMIHINLIGEKPLPGGGSYHVSRCINGIGVTCKMSDSCAERVISDIESLVHDYFRKTDIKTFRLEKKNNPVSFLPEIREEGGYIYLSFSDGSRVSLNRSGECYPLPATPGFPGWVKGKDSEEYKAFKFFRRIGEERAREALQRWARKGSFPGIRKKVS